MSTIFVSRNLNKAGQNKISPSGLARVVETPLAGSHVVQPALEGGVPAPRQYSCTLLRSLASVLIVAVSLLFLHPVFLLYDSEMVAVVQMSSAQSGRYDRCVSFPVSICYLNLSLKMPQRSCSQHSPPAWRSGGFAVLCRLHYIITPWARVTHIQAWSYFRLSC